MLKKKVLIVANEVETREMLAEALSVHYQVVFAKNNTEALASAKKNAPMMIIQSQRPEDYFHLERPLSHFTLNFGDLTLNFQDFTAEVNGTDLGLGQIEFKILSCLIKNPGQLVQRQTLHASIWKNESPPHHRALDAHMTTLRRKLKVSHSELKTIYGLGYSIVLTQP